MRGSGVRAYPFIELISFTESNIMMAEGHVAVAIPIS